MSQTYIRAKTTSYKLPFKCYKHKSENKSVYHLRNHSFRFPKSNAKKRRTNKQKIAQKPWVELPFEFKDPPPDSFLLVLLIIPFPKYSAITENPSFVNS